MLLFTLYRRATMLSLLLLSWIFAAGPVKADAVPLRIAVVANSASGKLTFSGIPEVVAADTVFSQALAAKGVRLEWVPVSTAAVATLVNESFASGKIDFAFYGDLPSVILNAAGVSTRLVVPGNQGNHAFLVVPPASAARSILDLKGKRIALHRGRPWEVTFAKLAAANGLTLKDFQIVNLNPQAGAAALAAGSVDAFFTLNDAFLLSDKKLGKIVWSTREAPLDWRMRAELWGSAAFLKAHPDISRLLATATVRAIYQVSQEKNREDYLKAQARFGLDESVLRREYDQTGDAWREYWSPVWTPAITRHYQDVIKHAVDTRLIRQTVPVESLFAPEFVPAALQDLKLTGYWKPAPGAKP